MWTVKLPRRTFLHLAAGAAALPAVSRIASALDYPSRPNGDLRQELAAGVKESPGRAGASGSL